MVTFHYIEFQAYSHATEDLERVKKAMENLAGKELEFEISDAEGYYGNPIKILEAKMSRNQEMDDFFERLPGAFIKELREELDRRIDKRCNFFFRVDKGKAYEDEIVLTKGGNSIQVRARVESYPSRKETAVKKMREYMDQR